MKLSVNTENEKDFAMAITVAEGRASASELLVIAMLAQEYGDGSVGIEKGKMVIHGITEAKAAAALAAAKKSHLAVEEK